MKKVTLIVSLVLAFCLPGFAQMAGQSGRPGSPGTPGGTDTPGATTPGATSPGSAGTHDSQMQNDTQTSGGMKSSPKMNKKMTATGCVSEKDGKYMLMSSQHPDGMELMTSENLKPHVGHTVKVSGMMENGSMSGGESKMSMMSMKMTSMKMVSESCTGGMNKSAK